MTWHMTNCVTLFSNDRFNILYFNRIKRSFRKIRNLCVRTVLTTGWTHSGLLCSETTSNVYQGRTEDQKYEINPVDQLCVFVCALNPPKILFDRPK